MQSLLPWQSHPCEDCLKELTPAPKLPVQEPFQQIYARWLLTGITYRLVLDWKSRPTSQLKNALLSKRVSEFDIPETPWLTEKKQVLVPIPQDLKRSWKLGQNPSLQIAHHLARLNDAPVIPLLTKHQTKESLKEIRQALQNQKSRWSTPSRWDVNHEVRLTAEHSIVLVDDILTTGSTLLSAAELLRTAGYTRISAWVLGVRPSFRVPRASEASKAPYTCSTAPATP